MLADLRNLLSIAYVSILGKYVQKLNVLVLWADSRQQLIEDTYILYIGTSSTLIYTEGVLLRY